MVYAKGGTSQFSGGKGNVMKMNVYQEISQIIKEADGILIGASNGLSIAEGYNIFADDAWFQENMGDFREKYGLRCVLHGFSVPMKVEEKWAFVSRLVKAKSSSRHDRRGSKRKSTQRVTAEMSKMRWRYGSKLG